MKSCTMPRTQRGRWAPLASVAALLTACGGGGESDDPRSAALGAGASSASCDTRVNNTQAKLQQCVTLAGVRRHQAALQAIADANGGVRAAGTPGYELSVQYIVDKATAAGYAVTLNAFPFTYVALPVVRQTAPTAATYESGTFPAPDTAT